MNRYYCSVARERGRWAVYFGLRDADPPPDPAETETSAQTPLKSPSWWLLVIVIGVGFGAAYEAVAAALGDGDFNLAAVPRVAVPAMIGQLVMPILEALSRWE